MNIPQAKTLLRGFAKTGFIQTSQHCRDRMKARDVTTEDILNVLMWGKVSELEENKEFQNWECVVEGKDLDGEKLTFVAAISEEENSILCITVY